MACCAGAAVLTGILNGIDDTVWNPATDSLIAAPFSAQRLPRRAANKAALQERLGLDADPDALLIGVVSRLTEQKGSTCCSGQTGDLVGAGLQFAILGSGEPALQHGFQAAAAGHPGQVGCIIGYDEALAHLIQAGSDAILMPSRFEPCGLTQLCALRYGAIPIVARVGGLGDTVIDANQAALTAGVATGIQFTPVTESALAEAMERAILLWQDKAAWTRMQRNALTNERAALTAIIIQSLAGASAEASIPMNSGAWASMNITKSIVAWLEAISSGVMVDPPRLLGSVADRSYLARPLRDLARSTNLSEMITADAMSGAIAWLFLSAVR